MEKIPNAFNDAAQITKSHVKAANVPAQITIDEQPATTLAPKAKRGRPPGSKDRIPRNKRPTATLTTIPTQDNENEEILLNYADTRKLWTREDTETNDNFPFLISQTISSDSPKPRTVHEAQQRDDWPLWETGINSKLDSLIS